MKTTVSLLKLPVLAAAMLAAASAQAIDFHVATPQQLQTALTLAAANGAAKNNIYLTNGYYTGNFIYNSAYLSSLVIQAETNLLNSQVSLDGGAQGVTLNLTCTTNVTISWLTFIRNNGAAGTASLLIGAVPGIAVLVQNTQFLGPTNGLGTGLIISSGPYTTTGPNVTITNCFVLGSGFDGSSSGVLLNGFTNNLTVVNSIFSTNEAGIYVGAGSPSYPNCNFTGNTFLGNNIAVELNGGNPLYANFIGNYFWGNGGVFGNAVLDGQWGTCNFTNNVFLNNSADQAWWGGGDSGGALSLSYASCSVVSNIFSGNYAASYGGAIVAGNSSVLIGNTFTGNSAGVGGAVSLGTPSFVVGNTFTGNTSAGQGGGAYCNCQNNGENCLISSNVFLQNISHSVGGGLFFSYSANVPPALTLQDNLIAYNTTTNSGYSGGGIFLSAGSALNMVNNTIFGNSASGQGGGMYIADYSSVNAIYNNIFWNNTVTVPGNGGDIYESGSSPSYFCNNDVNDLYGVWTVALNNLNVDPQFFNPVTGDLHLQSASPCRNAGSNSVPYLPAADLDGNSITNGSGGVDLGCYVFNNTATHPADTNSASVLTLAEFNAYAAAWKAGQAWTNAPGSAPNPSPIPANYLTRAGYLVTNGGAYYNNGSARPTNWRLPGH
jgi:hypothetical protein